MRVERGLPEGPPLAGWAPPAAATVGSFDGVHRGHVALVARLRAAAAEIGGEAVVVTFDPHPRCVLDPARCPATLTTVAEKAAILGELGVDRLLVVPFDDATRHWPAAAFIARVRAAARLARLVVGQDFALGHNRQGTIAWLTADGAEHGYAVAVVEPVLDGGQPVSSSRVRAAVAAGALDEAARLLGRPYRVEAPAARDGLLTCDLLPGKALPPAGGYAAWLESGGARTPVAALVGDGALLVADGRLAVPDGASVLVHLSGPRLAAAGDDPAALLALARTRLAAAG